MQIWHMHEHEQHVLAHRGQPAFAEACVMMLAGGRFVLVCSESRSGLSRCVTCAAQEIKSCECKWVGGWVFWYGRVAVIYLMSRDSFSVGVSCGPKTSTINNACVWTTSDLCSSNRVARVKVNFTFIRFTRFNSRLNNIFKLVFLSRTLHESNHHHARMFISSRHRTHTPVSNYTYTHVRRARMPNLLTRRRTDLAIVQDAGHPRRTAPKTCTRLSKSNYWRARPAARWSDVCVCVRVCRSCAVT